NLAYQYDPAGNRTSLTRSNAAASLLPAAVASASYDAANEQTAFAGQVLEYDANGNLWKEKDGAGTVLREYSWDARNRLIGISGNATATFKYDALGRRVSKNISGTITQYLYNKKDVVMEVVGGAASASYLRSLKIDESFVRHGGNPEYYYTDALGSVLTLADKTGTAQNVYSYEPFGKMAVTGATSNPLQYTGREADGTGLYYNRARYYSPQSQRFVSEDPILAPFTPLTVGMCQARNSTVWLLPSRIGLPVPDTTQFLNSYAYVSNNPIRLSDPSGLIGQAPCQSEINTCVNITKGTKIGECTGTAYGLYLGGDTGACKNRKYPNKQCMLEDYYTVSKMCLEYGKPYGESLPAECTVRVFNCILRME
ncbi:MAG: hypothetical protein OEV08_15180, partial [Nitrospira sp.]|nr:hypothetical protein [Nitrospira sp.]